MRTYPVFVPHDGERIAAVLTAPDDEPRGLVALLTGAHAPRSHRHQVWTRTAERLSRVGLASVRMDYIGTGDSTGALREWRLSDLPVDQVAAVLRFSMGALGVDRYAGVGTCGGARIAIDLPATLDGCVGTLAVRSPLLRPTRLSESLSARDRRVVPRAVRRSALVRRLARRVMRRKRRRSGAGVEWAIRSALEAGPLVFLYSEDDFSFSGDVARELDRIVTALPAQVRDRYELRVGTAAGLEGLDTLGVHDYLIETVTGVVAPWFASAAGPVESVPVRGAGRPPS